MACFAGHNIYFYTTNTGIPFGTNHNDNISVSQFAPPPTPSPNPKAAYVLRQPAAGVVARYTFSRHVVKGYHLPVKRITCHCSSSKKLESYDS